MLERNFRTRHGELDMVAADARHLVFCEVKTRVARRAAPGPLGPLAAIGPAQAPPAAAAGARVARRRAARQRPRPPELRFDAIGITLTGGGAPRLDHLEGAF